MDIFVLDTLLRRSEVIDHFESFVWTERFDTIGDFELVIHASWKNQQLLRRGVMLAINDSLRVMVVESIENKDGSDGQKFLTVMGRSLEMMLEERVARPNLENLTLAPRWPLIGTPGQVARRVFEEVCILGNLDSRDVIPFITAGSILPPDNIAEPNGVKRHELEIDTVYKTIQKICVENAMGLALVRNGDTSELYFEVYSGSDRTSLGPSNSPVIFSPELDNLSDTRHLSSIATYKNVAYVFSPSGSIVTYGDDNNHDHIAGFDRRAILVKVDNVNEYATEGHLTTDEILRRRGMEALLAHRKISMVDGEISKFSYRYNEDYNLGDIVELRKSADVTSYMRVTEQIFTSDAEGDKSYPTLTFYEN